MAKANSLTKFLAILGAILVFVDGVLSLLAYFGIFNYVLGGFFGKTLFIIGGLGWLNAVIVLVVGILAMISVDLFKGTIPFNGIWLLVLGIAAIVFGSWFIGGLLLVIAAILWFIKH